MKTYSSGTKETEAQQLNVFLPVCKRNVPLHSLSLHYAYVSLLFFSTEQNQNCIYATL